MHFAFARYAVHTIAALTLVASCGGDAGPTDGGGTDTPGATLGASPSTIALTEATPSAQLFLTTSPSGSTLNWQVTAKPAWLTVTPAQGRAKGITEVVLAAAITPIMDPGTYPGRLELVSSGGVVAVNLSLTLAASPKLVASSATVSIPATSDTGVVTLQNPGRGSTSWSVVTPLPAWLTVTPTSGYLGTAVSATVKLVPKRELLPAGTTSATVAFRTPTGTTANVALTVEVPPAPRAQVNVSRVVFTPSTAASTVLLVNPGRGPLNWSITNRSSWLTTTPASGSLAPGDTARISVTASAVASGSEGGFTITSDAVDEPTLRIAALSIANEGPTGVQSLPYRVVDAEFNAGTGQLVTVSGDPARLHVHDVATGQEWSLDLPKAPCCVAVRRDGRFAAVAHDALVSYVDLTTRTLVRTYNLSSNASDVFLPSNGAVHVLPRTDQWVDVHTVNLATGQETAGDGWALYANSIGRLHPTREVAYFIDRGLSPVDIHRLELSGGKAVVTGDSPYHGDYPIGADMWIGRDGLRIFTQMATVFRVSSVPSEDLRYAGKLEGACCARMIADEPVRRRIYGLVAAGSGWYMPAETRTGSITTYDGSTLVKLGEATLPGIPAGSSTVAADGWYIFPSANGDRLYVLMKAVQGSGLLNDWALYTVSTAGMP